MKICKDCKQNKSFTEFYKHKLSRDKLHPNCKTCFNIKRASYYADNKKKLNNINKINYQNNKKHLLEQKKIYRELNPHKIKLADKTWRQANQGKINAKNNKRRAFKLQATPKWLTNKHLKQIEAIYRLTSTLTKITNVKYHVDHIYPLQGKTSSGLHVPWNLRIVRATKNLSKGNKLPYSHFPNISISIV